MTSSSASPTFPVDNIKQVVCDDFEHSDIILTAPPGAGKSTRIPLALLARYPDKRFVMLQPRRVVVRHLARFLAQQLNQSVGQTIGYRMRGESKHSAQTRLTIMTEGVLTRCLQEDPELSGIDGILFDEFHERSVHADLGLAFALESQQMLRPSLRLMVMSATLDIDALRTLLPDAVHHASDGRMFPVEVKYLGDCKTDLLSDAVVSAVQQALDETDTGSILVFLPSAKLIRQCHKKLMHLPCEIAPLYGALSLDEQTQAIQPAQGSQRKIILATNIAETSLTIDGVSVVVDSGRAQQAKYNTQSAITALATKMISQPSATQRMGRAGRLSEGICYRLWSASSQQRLERLVRPAIKEVDLTPHLLDVLVWGSQFSELALIDQPDSVQLQHAATTLELLGLTQSNGALTASGRQAQTMGFHPRVATLLLAGDSLSSEQQVAVAMVASLIEHAASMSVEHIDALSNRLLTAGSQQRKTLQDALARFGQSLSSKTIDSIKQIELPHLAAIAAKAYPERVAYRQAGDTFKLAYGPRFSAAFVPKSSHWCVLLHGIYQGSGQLVAFTALPAEQDMLQQHLPKLFSQSQSLVFDAEKQSLEARQVYSVGSSQYRTEPVSNQKQIDWKNAWLHAIRQGDLGLPPNLLPLSKEGKQVLARMRIATHLNLQQFADCEFDDEQLLGRSELWLDMHLSSCRTLKDLQNLPWHRMLESLLTWEQQQSLNAQLPEKVKTGTGTMLLVDYQFEQSDDNTEVSAHLSVKLQMMFGINQAITLANGKLPLTLHLLSPAGRPLQTTQDLAAFWQGSYHSVAKEMRGRYPKHPWPDNPQSAKAMAGTKKAHGI